MPRPRKQPGELGTPRVYPVGGKYRAQVFIRDLDGEGLTLSALGASATEAEERLIAKAHNVWGGLFASVDGASTVRELAHLWVLDLERRTRIQQNTREGYAGVVRNLILPTLGEVTLGRLNAGVCDRFLKQLLQTRSASYVRQCRRVLHQMLRFAVLHGAIEQNYVRDADPLPPTEPTYVELTPAQVSGVLRLLNEEPCPHRRGPRPDLQMISDLIILMLATSMRPGEVLALRPEAIQLREPYSLLSIEATITTSTKNGTEWKPKPKQFRQKRSVSVPIFADEVLRRRLDSYMENPERLLFASSNGTPLSVRNLNIRFNNFKAEQREALEALGIDLKTLTFRAFRKTVATVLNNEGGVELSRKMLGHKDARTTIEHYIKPQSEVPSLTAEILDAHFSGSSGGEGDGSGDRIRETEGVA